MPPIKNKSESRLAEGVVSGLNIAYRTPKLALELVLIQNPKEYS